MMEDMFGYEMVASGQQWRFNEDTDRFTIQRTLKNQQKSEQEEGG